MNAVLNFLIKLSKVLSVIVDPEMAVCLNMVAQVKADPLVIYDIYDRVKAISLVFSLYTF